MPQAWDTTSPLLGLSVQSVGLASSYPALLGRGFLILELLPQGRLLLPSAWKQGSLQPRGTLCTAACCSSTEMTALKVFALPLKAHF